MLATWLSSTCSSGSGDDPDSCHVVMRLPWKANKLWDDLRLRIKIYKITRDLRAMKCDFEVIFSGDRAAGSTSLRAAA